MAVQNQTRRGVRHAEDAGPRASPAGPRRRTAAPPSPRLSSALGCDGAPPPAGSASRGGPRAGGWPCSSPRTRRASKASHTVSIQAGPRTIALTHFFLRFTEASKCANFTRGPFRRGHRGPCSARQGRGLSAWSSARGFSSTSAPRGFRKPSGIVRFYSAFRESARSGHPSESHFPPGPAAEPPPHIRTRGVGSPCGWSFTSETAAAARAVTLSVACFAAA